MVRPKTLLVKEIVQTTYLSRFIKTHSVFNSIDFTIVEKHV